MNKLSIILCTSALVYASNYGMQTQTLSPENTTVTVKNDSSKQIDHVRIKAKFNGSIKGSVHIYKMAPGQEQSVDLKNATRKNKGSGTVIGDSEITDVVVCKVQPKGFYAGFNKENSKAIQYSIIDNPDKNDVKETKSGESKHRELLVIAQ